MSDYFDSGFAVRVASWHGKEDLLDEAPDNWGDARKAARLMWEPVDRPQFITRYSTEFALCRSDACAVKIGKPHTSTCEVGQAAQRRQVELVDTLPEGSVVGTDGRHIFVPDPEHKQILRNDTFAMLETGANSGFQLVYHGKGQGPSHDALSMEEIIDTFVPAGAKFDTSGSARGGALVYAVMYLDEPFSVTGDVNGLTLPYITLLNGHTGNAACKLLDSAVRVVCANTWQMCSLEGDASGRQIVFRHSGDMAPEPREAVSRRIS